MNYWYAPVNESHLQITPRLPPELIAAVAAPWRSATELEAIRAKAKRLSHYDMSGAAHSVLMARKQQASEDAIRALRQGQSLQELQQDVASLGAVTAVDAMWAIHLDQLRGEASAAVQALQEKHEDALTKLRLDQVARAHDSGIRTNKRSKELLNLRRSESVLVSKHYYNAAARVKSRVDELAAAEANGAHTSWLLKCHSEQERLLAQQRRELETLCKRLDERLSDVEVARDRDLDKLDRKIKVAGMQQHHSFVKERQHLEAALGGCMLNTRTTRIGRGVADAFPTLAGSAAASQRKPEPPGARPASSGARSAAASAPELQHGSAYLGPGTSSEGAVGRWQGEEPGVAFGVRFAPTPRREAWGAGGSAEAGSGSSGSRLGSAGSGSGINIGGGSGQSRSSNSSSGSKGVGRGSYGDNAEPMAPGNPLAEIFYVHGDSPSSSGGLSPVVAVGGAPSSAAVGSRTTVVETDSGSSALTEEALRAMNQAMGAQPSTVPRGANSLHSSSFKSNKPYAGGLSARTIAQPVSRLVL